MKKILRRTSSCFFLWVAVATGAFGQSGSTSGPVGSISGVVLRPAGGPSIEGLTVQAATGGQTTSTDVYGRFHLLGLAPGTYALKITGSRYAELDLNNVVVQPGTDTQLAPAEIALTAESVAAHQQSDIVQLEKYEVVDRTPFSGDNVDIVRTMNDAQPYYIFNNADLQSSGASNLEDFLDQQLSMNTNGQPNSAKPANSGGTTSQINLRGFGSNQTLILIDGHRMGDTFIQAGLSGTDQPDLNTIPMAAVDHIDIIPTSSAAIYGSGAIGGVINVVLKNDFTGGQLQVQYDNPFVGNAPERSIDLTYGIPLEGGKTHIMISGHYDDNKPLDVQDRSFISDYLDRTNANNPSQLSSLSTPYPGATPNISTGSPSVPLVLKNGTSLNSPITYVPSGFTAASNPQGFVANAGQWNYNNIPAPYVAYAGGFYDGLGNLIGQPERDKSLMVDINRQMTDKIRVYVEYSTESDISFTLINRDKTLASVPASAPDNPFEEAVVVSYPTNLPMPYKTDYVTWRVTPGVVVDLPFKWKGEVDYTWTGLSSIYYNGAMDTGPLKSAFSSGALNPFVDTLANPLNLTPYIGEASDAGNGTTNDYEARFAGPVGELPAGAPELTFGGEHRKEGWHDQPTITVFPNDPADNTDLIYYGQCQSITSEYAEAKVPVFSSRNALPGLALLDFDLAVRNDNYSVSTNTAANYAVAPASTLASNVPLTSGIAKFGSLNESAGLRYSPFNGLMLRASYGVSNNPPSVADLTPVYSNQFNQSYTDPLRGNMITAFQPGVTSIEEGGNPDLRPETADTWTAGVVVTPPFIPGLRIAVDWYDIWKHDQITELSFQQVINDVAEGILPANLVQRGALTASDQALGYTGGPIQFVNFANVNLANAQVEGYDVTVAYRVPTASCGTFDLSILGTFAQHAKEQVSADGPYIDLIGVPSYGSSPQPPVRFQGNATLKWDYHQWTLGWNTEYVSSYYENGPPYNTSTTFDVSLGSNTVPSQMYHNVFAKYRFGRAQHPTWTHWVLDDLSITVGVKDLFNTVPPFDPWFNNAGGVGYFYSQYGDARLRQYWLQVTKAF